MKHQYQEQIAQIKEKLDISVLVGEHVRLKRIGRDYTTVSGVENTVIRSTGWSNTSG
jgi:hypothetical protein